MEAVLEAVRRDSFGGNEAGRMRRAGQMPAVLYGGPKGEAVAVTVDPKALMHILHSDSGVNTLISLKLDGAETKVLVKEFQIHPLGQHLLHADFYRLAMDKVIEVTVPIHLTGESKGVKVQGGTVDFVHRELVVECLPSDIPEHVTIDITELMLHQGVRVKDLDTGGKWTALSEPEMLIVHVVSPRVEAEPAADAEAAVAGATAAEPEVIKKGKADAEGDDKDKDKDKEKGKAKG
jgi:large subunit ribosomal protein L25